MAKKIAKSKPVVSIVMGSRSDLKVMKMAVECLKHFGVSYETKIVSAHRTPTEMYKYASEAAERSIKVIIAGAGGAAHLPGMIASLTSLPVIGVPVNVTALEGVDSLLSIVQMPKGVPVATVAIDNAFNAGLLAVRILACSGDKPLTKKLIKFSMSEQKRVLKAKL